MFLSVFLSLCLVYNGGVCFCNEEMFRKIVKLHCIINTKYN